jgi:type IV secretion system protein VirD4
MSALVPSVWHTNGGIYCGYGTGNTEGPPAIGDCYRYTGDRHVVWIGNNGSGKSRRLLAVNLAKLTGWSVVVVDPKGILRKMLGPHRAAHGAENVDFNPYGVFGIPSRGWNQLSALDPASDDFLDDAMAQSEGTIEVTPGTNDPHWPETAQDWFAAVAMYCRLVIPGSSYATVRELMAQPDEVLREMVLGAGVEYQGKQYPNMIEAGIDGDWPEIGNKAARFGAIDPANRELHSVMSTGLTKTRFLDSRAIKRELAGPPFDARELKKRPISVWLILPARRIGSHAKWFGLTLTTIIQQLMEDTAKESDVPVAIICDEAAALGHLPVLQTNVALMREYGLKLITVWQDLPQLQHVYKDRWESFIGNAGVLQSFSAHEKTTAEYLSAMTGQTTRQAIALGLSENLQAGAPPSYSTSATRSPFPMPLMLPQDIRALPEGYSVLWSHKIANAATALAYLPYPTQIADMQAIMALDPAA